MLKSIQNNKRYSNYDDKFVIGKSSIDQENFDVLVFCFHNLEKVTIPDFTSSNSKLLFLSFSSSNIKNFTIPSQLVKIAERAFYYCEHLNEFKIPLNSNLKIIENEY